MVGYKRSAWAEKVGVTINVVSNIHGASAKQNPSLNYILAVSIATGKPMDYYLWGEEPAMFPDPRLQMVRESGISYSDDAGIPRTRDLQMGRWVRYWRQDMALTTIPEVARLSLVRGCDRPDRGWVPHLYGCDRQAGRYVALFNRLSVGMRCRDRWSAVKGETDKEGSAVVGDGWGFPWY